MRFRKSVGPLVLMGLLAACGSRAQTGGFHPNGQAPGDGASAASSSGATGGATAGDDAPGAGAPAPKTPQSALAAYRAYQLAYERAYETNDAGGLSAVAMDPLLSKVTQDIGAVRAQGLIWRFHNILNPRVQGSSSDLSTVVILDCVRTLGSYKYSAKTGRRLTSWRGGTVQYQAVMRYSDDVWKISEATEGEKC
ncbi:hypothetical protein GCM10023191_098080 [Actinoallomurus oryzae]|uniref:Secreted protein/lipoprotein n=1 Tax=Actinoallomurus oryzae TaxID=502180 RepID=A0ABP8R8R4_9ACTN